MKIIGIDDAGRGPVLGPMILAGVIIEQSDEKKLAELDVKDSKMLLPSKRKKISEKIKQDFTYHVELTTPEEIDNSQNLNDLEAIKTAMIINKLTKNLNEKIKVVVDCPSINIKSWTEFLSKLIDKKDLINLSCEHKADVNHKVVSAASIIAKEKREDEMEKLRAEYKIDFGSGYPADPKTKEFIEKFHNHEKYSKIIRHSWSTVQRLSKDSNSKQQKLF